MAKLGYTFYPKDWGNSEAVFELNLSERGLYRELIDLAMMNDNNTEVKIDTWCRKFAVSTEDINKIIDKLINLNLVSICNNIMFIPSCENRLKLVRGGKKGGETSKPTAEHIVNPVVKPLDKPTHKPKVNQIETKDKLNKTKENIDSRKLKFADTLKPFLSKYGNVFLNEFYAYWTEPNVSGTKFRAELQKTWSVEMRLSTWAKNDKNFKPKTEPKKSLGL